MDVSFLICCVFLCRKKNYDCPDSPLRASYQIFKDSQFKIELYSVKETNSRYLWSRSVWNGSAAVRLLGLRVRIPPRA
jgi:hypothetical protein